MSSSIRGRIRSQRGFALISALVLAVLYFGLMELMLIDTTHALREADRFRSRVVSQTLAENGAELAAAQIVSNVKADVSATDEQGTMSGTLDRGGEKFVITGHGESSGVRPSTASVKIEGTVVGSHVTINYTDHSQ